jgi:N-methylhydantoinase A
MNAYTMPKIAALAERLGQALADFGFEGAFSVIQSNGGVMSLDKARTHPVNTLLSGPAAGVVAAAAVGRAAETPRLIAFDVGGTSTDISLVEGGAVRLSAEGGIGGYPVKVPQVRVHTIGAGGGSIARPELGLLKVGPHSAGAHPGPAAYGRGGTEPTATDAAVVLGYIDPERFLDGEIGLDAQAARRAVEEKVAVPLGLDIDAAALAILRVQAANIVAGIRKVSVEAGKDPREHVLMPFGGAGGMFAGIVAEEAGIARVLLPPHASVLSALGMLMTDIRHDRSRTLLRPLAGAEAGDLGRVFAVLMAEAAEELARDHIGEDRRTFEFACDMRYEGQSYEITVPVGAGTVVPAIDAAALRTAFDAAHAALYGQASPGEPVEIVNFRVGGIGAVEKIALPDAAVEVGAGPVGRRPVLFLLEAGWVDCPVHERAGLAAGAVLEGPAIIEDRGASIPVRPGHRASVGDRGIVFIDVGFEGAAALPAAREAAR